MRAFEIMFIHQHLSVNVQVSMMGLHPINQIALLHASWAAISRDHCSTKETSAQFYSISKVCEWVHRRKLCGCVPVWKAKRVKKLKIKNPLSYHQQDGTYCNILSITLTLANPHTNTHTSTQVTHTALGTHYQLFIALKWPFICVKKNKRRQK